MRLSEFVKTIDSEKYRSYLLEAGNSEATVNKIMDVFSQLCKISPKTPRHPFEIIVFKGGKFSELSNNLVVECVYVKVPMENVPEDYEELERHIARYSFSGIKWSEVLSYKINECSMKDYSKFFIMTAIIDEISDFGWTEEEIETRLDEIRELLAEARNDVESGNYVEYKDTRSPEEIASAHERIAKAAKQNLQTYYDYLKNSEVI